MTQRGFTMLVWLGLAVAGVAEDLAQESAKKPPKTLTNSIGLELVLIPAGEFDIGTPDSARYNPWPSEQPQHRVKISRAFYLGKFEVTQDFVFFMVVVTRPSLGGLTRPAAGHWPSCPPPSTLP